MRTPDIFYSLVFAAVLPLLAQGEEHVRVSQAARVAERVALVEVTAVEVREGRGGNIFTFVSFRNLETVRGHLPAEFQARLLGGKLGDRDMTLDLVEPFEAGHRYVTLLGGDNASGYVTIFPQGIFPVHEGAGGPRVATRPGIPLVHHETGNAYDHRPTTVSVTDFLASLVRLSGGEVAR
jgi:hypothetical protein